jgi:transposase
MAEPRERAAKLRDAGLSYEKIARDLDVGSATVYRWLNPEYNERHLAVSRAWKDAHREQDRARNRAYAQAHRYDLCPHCGNRKCDDSEMCVECRDVTATVRRSLGEGMWADGWSMAEFREILGVHAPTMRERGWDLPYRYRNTKRQLAA